LTAGAASLWLFAAAEAGEDAARAPMQDFAAAPMPKKADAIDVGPPASTVVVELFLSQACIKCPPAAALLPEIAARDGVIALSWHVDYWNMTNSKNGQWADPFSATAFTRRQKLYNVTIRNRNSVYTPQVVIGGESETVGSNKEKIDILINATRLDSPTAPVEVARENENFRFSVGEMEDGGNAYLVTFRPFTRTKITGGANAGEIFNEVNVVTGVRRLGAVLRSGGDIAVEPPAPGEGCALIIQAPKQRRIIAASYCP